MAPSPPAGPTKQTGCHSQTCTFPFLHPPKRRPNFLPANLPPHSHRFTTNIPLIISSCRLFHVTPNTLDEILSIHRAILTISAATNTDARFILAIILQESNGCVRVPTSFYSLRNPGLMQSHNGPATCNEDATPIYPCP
ncbi:MAG: hypothetical protein Q9215_003117, partial [Flavoplaca cf. flavocitrina]